MKRPNKILMIEPEYYRIEYVINPHMTGPDGSFLKVDGMRATQQWRNLKGVFESLDLGVQSLPGSPELPDQVFCANPAFSFLDLHGQPSVLKSRMKHGERSAEVDILTNWFRGHGRKVYENPVMVFEGMGDAIWDYETGCLYGGFGFRTEKDVYEKVKELTGVDIIPLRLVDEKFYHLDTCFAVLGGGIAAVVKESLSEESLSLLKERFRKLIWISREEALKHFAGNAFCPDGKHVVLQTGATEFLSRLRHEGFAPIEVDTSEFMKAGGSVFCMKLLYF